MDKQSKKLFITLIISILVVCVICLAVVGYFSKGFKDWEWFDQMVNDGQPSLSPDKNTSDKMTVSTIDDFCEDYRIDVVNGGKYSVMINVDNEQTFEFMLDGMYANLKDNSIDWNEFFNVQIYQNYFTLDTSLKSIDYVLKLIYPNNKITDVPTENIAYFILYVISEDGKQIVKQPLAIGDVVLNIELDITEVEF